MFSSGFVRLLCSLSHVWIALLGTLSRDVLSCPLLGEVSLCDWLWPMECEQRSYVLHPR